MDRQRSQEWKDSIQVNSCRKERVRPAEVLRRIESIILQLVDGVSQGYIPDLAVVRSCHIWPSPAVLSKCLS